MAGKGGKTQNIPNGKIKILTIVSENEQFKIKNYVYREVNKEEILNTQNKTLTTQRSAVRMNRGIESP